LNYTHNPELVKEDFLPFSLPTIGKEEITEVADSLRSGWVTTRPKTKRCEEQFREYIGSKRSEAAYRRVRQNPPNSGRGGTEFPSLRFGGGAGGGRRRLEPALSEAKGSGGAGEQGSGGDEVRG